jgi:hypothetical protein
MSKQKTAVFNTAVEKTKSVQKRKHNFRWQYNPNSKEKERQKPRDKKRISCDSFASSQYAEHHYR